MVQVNTWTLVCWMSFYVVNSCVTIIRVKLQDIPSAQMIPPGSSQLGPPMDHRFSDCCWILSNKDSQPVLTRAWLLCTAVSVSDDRAYIFGPFLLPRASPMWSHPHSCFLSVAGGQHDSSVGLR